MLRRQCFIGNSAIIQGRLKLSNNSTIELLKKCIVTKIHNDIE